MDYYIFLVTVPNIEEGKKIANILVENRLVACVNIIQNVFSIYRWKGNIERENEVLLIIKTTERNSDLLIQKVKEIHSYSNPECVAFKIEKGSKKYLDWISEVVD
ncbi:MAG: divalent-cation tolerance protein CutA [Candidatus Lokiarchaeota archaeon]|nr:divalent-cation tolerance protein CutA [Candidatus Lokiarchaeota archaeon]